MLSAVIRDSEFSVAGCLGHHFSSLFVPFPEVHYLPFNSRVLSIAAVWDGCIGVFNSFTTMPGMMANILSGAWRSPEPELK